MSKRLFLFLSVFVLSLSGKSFAQAPKADLLDIQFLEDGTAVDASAREMIVRKYGEVEVYYSEIFQRYVARFDNEWAGNTKGVFKADFEADKGYCAALADGHSIECLVKPEFVGTIPNREAKPFTATYGGGTGFTVGPVSTDRFSFAYIPNVTTTGKSNWIWSTSGVVPQTQVYYHLVGVWDKDAQEAKVYVNGVLMNTVPAVGEFRFANPGCNAFCVGSCPGDGPLNCYPSAFRGDIVLARVYNKPLKDDEVKSIWDELEAPCREAQIANNRQVVEEGQQYAASVVATQELIDSYKAALAELSSVISQGPDADPSAQMFNVATLRVEVENSAAIYVKYAEKKDAAEAALEKSSAQGAARKDLETYLSDTYPTIWNAHRMSNEEITNEISVLSKLLTAFEDLAATVPVADLLDIQFREDGTAMDASAQERPVVKYGEVDVYYDPVFQRNVARFDNEWAGVTKGVFKADFESDAAYRAALADGHTIECLVKPNFDGTIPNREAKPFTATYGGGTGFTVGPVNTDRFSFAYIPNVTTTGNSNWIWTTSGIVPQTQYYYHLVGVWDKDAQEAKVYVNGELMNTVPAVGEMRFANPGCNAFCVGSCPGDGPLNCYPSAFRGDIILARVYDKPLTGNQVKLLWGEVEEPCSVAQDALFRQILEEGQQYKESVLATQNLVDSYEEALNELGRMISEGEAAGLSDQVAKVVALRAKVEASAANYQKYLDQAEETKKYLEEHDDFAGPDREKLEFYLSEFDEPGEEFSNGSYEYICETHTLTNDEIAAEAQKIADMLATAIMNGSLHGSEITKFLTNPDFADGFNGWSGTTMSSIVKSDACKLYGVEASGKKFDMYQTLSDLNNGVYAVTASATYRPFDDPYSTYYSAFMYMNGMNLFLPTVYESRVSVDDADDGENCYLTATNINDDVVDVEVCDEFGDVIGYAIQGRTGMANAAAAGRAQNCLVTKVTNGTLKLGFQNPHADYASDWTGLSNIHLYYLGETLDDAEYYLDKALACYVDRAKTIINLQPSTGSDYALNPNCSKEIKDKLQEAVDAVAAAASLEEKYELQNTFTQLFATFLEGRAAYVKLIDELVYIDSQAGMKYDAEVITNEEYEAFNDLYNSVFEKYENGVYTTEEALAMEDLRGGSLLAKLLKPVADLLDIKFTEDGSAYDASIQSRDVVKYGDVDVYYSETFQRYVARFDNEWAGVTKGVFKADFESDAAYRAALANGHTIECLVKPNFDGTIPNREAKPFTATYGGGTGFTVGPVNTDRFSFAYIPNVTTTGNSNWIWTTSGIVPQTQYYYHLVGVWDRDTQEAKIYVNGELKNTVPAVGEFRFANPGCNAFCVGSCPGDGPLNCYPSAFRGDVVLARVYNRPLSQFEIDLLWEDLEAPCNQSQDATYRQIVEKGTEYAASVVATQELIDNYKTTLATLNEMLSQSSVAELEAQAEVVNAARKDLDISASAYQAYKDMKENAETFLAEHNVQGATRSELQSYITETFPTVWNEHKLSTEEIQAETNKMKDLLVALEILVESAPVADLLDIQFLENGSATDASAWNRNVVKYGDVEVYYSDIFKRYVARFNNDWAGNTKGVFKADFESDGDYREALADGHTIECLVMPNFEGDIPNREAKPFAATYGGGTGFTVGPVNTDRFSFAYIPNVTTTGNSNWIWTTSGIVPQTQLYYHLVGVWDKEAQEAKIYVNGELMNTVPAPGNLRFANPGCNAFCIGSCPGDGPLNCYPSAFRGDIVLARVYDKSLKESEVKLLWSELETPCVEAQSATYRNLVEEGLQYAASVVATQEIIDSYKAAISELDNMLAQGQASGIPAQVAKIVALRAEVEASASVYEAYSAKAKAAQDGLGKSDAQGPARDELQAYLSDTYATIWSEHKMSNEEIQSETAHLDELILAFEDLADTPPVADLLDVRFLEDGTAFDASAQKRNIVKYGDVEVYYSEEYNRNVARFDNEWAGNTKGVFKADFESDAAYRAALADGHTIECLVRPDFDGTIPNREAKPLAATYGGGTGFTVGPVSTDRFSFAYIPNVTTTGNSNWIWTTSGIVPESQVYYHLVGVWDKDAQESKIYVNGELMNTVPAEGNLRFANPGCNAFCIGSCPGDGPLNCYPSAFRGDIVLARVYDKPLTDRQVSSLWKHVYDKPDGVKSMAEETISAKDGIFTINGIKVEKTSQGVYIINGKTVLVK